MTEGDLLRFAPILGEIIPELKPTFGYDQRNPHHAHDLYTHIAHVTAAVPPELPLRWAALLHDIGKPATSSIDEKGIAHYHGHAQVSAEMAAEVLRRLKAPTQLREQVVALIDQHMTYPLPDKKWLRRRLSRLGEDTLKQLLALQQADTGSKGTSNEGDWDYFRQIHNILSEILAENACLQIRDLAVNGHDLMSLGIQGRAIGQTLNCLLEAVIDEQLPNEKTALLAAARHLQSEESL
jgi:tRNA nucleotidyltransferase (CCA-adding enzyme)